MTAPHARVQADLATLLSRVTAAYQLGPVQHWSVLTTGYEDCNVAVQTSEQHLVIKVFATGRAGIAKRTAAILEQALAAGVAHPRLHRSPAGRLVHHELGHAVLIMDHARGATVYDLGRAPTRAELAALLRQTVQLHSTPIRQVPKFVADPWAITNLEPLARELDELLDREQQQLVAQAVAAVQTVDRAALPHALIHGDLTQGNVLMCPEDEQVTVLDFAVATWAPRVQELAVIAANLTHGDPAPLPERARQITELYSATAPTPLSQTESAAMQAYSHAGAAMEFLGALRAHHHGHHSAETDMLIELGLSGLRDCAAVSSPDSATTSAPPVPGRAGADAATECSPAPATATGTGNHPRQQPTRH